MKILWGLLRWLIIGNTCAYQLPNCRSKTLADWMTRSLIAMPSDLFSSVAIRKSSALVRLEDLCCFSGISAILRLGRRRKSISEIQVARLGIEPQTTCPASQELNHSTTAAMNRLLSTK